MVDRLETLCTFISPRQISTGLKKICAQNKHQFRMTIEQAGLKKNYATEQTRSK